MPARYAGAVKYAPAPTKDSGTSLGRAFAVLDLFTLAHPIVTVEYVTEALEYTRSTAYRYLRELAGAGLITQAAPGVYSLGPRIIELERLMALTDPLYRAGLDVLPQERQTNTALLLHNLYEDKVLCILKAGPDALECGGQRITIRRARGLPFPLFQGAASLAMLPCCRRTGYARPIYRIRNPSRAPAWAKTGSSSGAAWWRCAAPATPPATAPSHP